MDQQAKMVFSTAFGFFVGVVLTTKMWQEIHKEHEKQVAKLQMMTKHMLNDFSPYVPEEILRSTREKMEFEAIVIEEEGIAT